jgi:hypothetical protein
MLSYVVISLSTFILYFQHFIATSLFICSSLTTRRYIPEDGTLHNHSCENLKSYKELDDCYVGFEVLTVLVMLSCWFLAWVILRP